MRSSLHILTLMRFYLGSIPVVSAVILSAGRLVFNPRYYHSYHVANILGYMVVWGVWAANQKKRFGRYM